MNLPVKLPKQYADMITSGYSLTWSKWEVPSSSSVIEKDYVYGFLVPDDYSGTIEVFVNSEPIEAMTFTNAKAMVVPIRQNGILLLGVRKKATTIYGETVGVTLRIKGAKGLQLLVADVHCRAPPLQQYLLSGERELTIPNSVRTVIQGTVLNMYHCHDAIVKKRGWVVSGDSEAYMSAVNAAVIGAVDGAVFDTVNAVDVAEEKTKLADWEKRLEAYKELFIEKTRTETEKAQGRLDAREQRLDARDATQNQRQVDMAGDWAMMLKNLETHERTRIASWDKVSEKVMMQQMKSAQALDERDSELGAKESALETRAQALDIRVVELDKGAKTCQMALVAENQKLKARLKGLDEREAELDKRDRMLSESLVLLDGVEVCVGGVKLDMNAVIARVKQANALMDAVVNREKACEEEECRLNLRDHVLDAREADLDDQELALDEEKAKWANERLECQKKMDAAQKKLDVRAAELDVRDRMLSECQATLDAAGVKLCVNVEAVILREKEVSAERTKLDKQRETDMATLNNERARVFDAAQKIAGREKAREALDAETKTKDSVLDTKETLLAKWDSLLCKRAEKLDLDRTELDAEREDVAKEKLRVLHDRHALTAEVEAARRATDVAGWENVAADETYE